MFNDHIKVTNAKPKVLFKLQSITSNGHSTDWAAIAKEYSLIADMLDHTKGQMVLLSCIKRNLKKWTLCFHAHPNQLACTSAISKAASINALNPQT